MVAGADTMLDIVAGKAKDVVIQMDEKPFPGADELVLTERCTPSMGGGYYVMERFEGRPVRQRMWLCAFRICLWRLA